MTEKRPEIDSDSIIGAVMKGDIVGIRDARLNQIIGDITEWARASLDGRGFAQPGNI